MDVDSYSTAAGAVIATGTIAAAAWKGKPAVVAVGRYVVAWFRLPSQVSTMSATVEKELTPNGGGSMRDLVGALAKQVRTGDARDRALFAHMEIAYWESDSHGDCVYASRELLRITGRTIDEYLGRAWVSGIHPAQRESVLEEWDACVRDQRDFAMDYSFVRPCGEEVPVRAEASIVRGAKGETVMFVGRVVERRVL